MYPPYIGYRPNCELIFRQSTIFRFYLKIHRRPNVPTNEIELEAVIHFQIRILVNIDFKTGRSYR